MRGLRARATTTSLAAMGAAAATITALLAGCGGGGSDTGSHPTYTITNLGGATQAGTVARRINDAGLVTGYTTSGTDVPLRAILARAGVVPGEIPLPENATRSTVDGLNDAGQVAGTAIVTAANGAPMGRAFVYDAPTGALQLLPSLPRGENQAEARAVNSTGQIVVGSAFTGQYISPPNVGAQPFAIFHPVLWSDGQIRDLGTLGGQAGDYGYATDVNGVGQVVGTSVLRAFLWQNDKMTALGGDGTSAEAINSRGDVAGSDNGQAAVWPAGGGERRLGKLNNDATHAWDINDAGVVVGNAQAQVTTAEPFAGTRAWVSVNGRITDLNRQIPANSGWSLKVAYGINNRGQIVGVGTLNGAVRAFLLTPVPQQ